MQPPESSPTIEEVLAPILARIEEDPSFDPAAMIAQHPALAPEIESRVALLRAAGLLGSSPWRATPSSPPPELGPPVRLREVPEDMPPRGTDEIVPAKPIAGRYRLTATIGAGGMGLVFRAVDLELGRDVAVKIARERSSASPRNPLGRFVREAQVTAQLDHPGIVPVHEAGMTDDERLFYVMKLVRGRSLQEILAGAADPRPATLPVERCVEVVRRICEAVAYAHARGVVHRDLKPSNVMVGSFGEVLVMDWGLARILDAAREDGAHLSSSVAASGADGDGTRPGGLIGSPAYAAPEQARGDRDRLDERTDVFGIGAVLSFLMTGKPLYAGSSAAEVEALAREGVSTDPLLRGSRFRVPREIRAIVRKATAARQEDRYASVRELEADLQAFVERRTGSAWRENPWSWSRKLAQRHPAVAVSAVIALPLLIASVNTYRNDSEAKLRRRREELLTVLTRRDLQPVVLPVWESEAGARSPWRHLTQEYPALPRWESPPEDARSGLVPAAFHRLLVLSEGLQRAGIHDPLAMDPADVAASIDGLRTTEWTTLQGSIVQGWLELYSSMEWAGLGRAHRFLNGSLPWNPSPGAEASFRKLGQEYASLVARFPQVEAIVRRLLPEPRRWVFALYQSWFARRELGEYEEQLTTSSDSRDLTMLGGLLRNASTSTTRTAEEREILRRASRRAFERALDLDPGNDVAHLQLAQQTELDPAHPEDAVKSIYHLSSAVAVNPSNFTATVDLAGVLVTEGRYEIAERLANRAIRIRPDDPFGWFARATVWSRRGEKRRALDEARRLVHSFPDSVQGWAFLGDRLNELEPGDAAGRLEAFVKSLRPSPLPLTSSALCSRRFEVARAFTDLERWEESLREATALRDDSSCDLGADLDLELARALAGSGDVDAAIRSLEELLGRMPEDPRPLEECALIRLRTGETQSAVAALDQAVQLRAADRESGRQRWTDAQHAWRAGFVLAGLDASEFDDTDSVRGVRAGYESLLRRAAAREAPSAPR